MYGDEAYTGILLKEYPPMNTPWARNADRVLREHPHGTHAYWTNFTTLVADTLPFTDGETELNWLIRALENERISRYVIDNPVPQYWSETPGQMKISTRALFGGPTRPGQSPHRPRSVWTKLKQAIGFRVEERGYKRVWNILAKFSFGIEQPKPLLREESLPENHPLRALISDCDEDEDPSWYDDPSYGVSYDSAAAMAAASPSAASYAAAPLCDSSYYENPFAEPLITTAVADDDLIFPFDDGAACVSSAPP